MKKFKFGKAFPDSLRKITKSSGHFHNNTDDGLWQGIFSINTGFETQNLSIWRYVSITVFIICIFLIILMRLFQLQILEGATNRDLANSNRIKIKVVHAPRGVIYDRNGKILTQNEPAFRLQEDGNQSKIRYLSRDEALKLEVNHNPRFEDLEVDNVRAYPAKEATAHILGYVSQITKEELESFKAKGQQSSENIYKNGDKIGRSGVEQTYEKVLKGVDGGEIIEVDSNQKKIRTLRESKVVAGHNLYLSIDLDLQLYAFKLLAESISSSGSCCGALIIQDPSSGEILALVSIPSFNPIELEKSLNAQNSPFLNRVIAGTYPPGSVFKIVSSLAALSSGKILENTQFEDTGITYLGPFQFGNWYFTQYGKLEGLVDLKKALKRSNDTYFYRVGQIIGEKALASAAKTVGFGRKVGIDLPGEAVGLVPDNEWKVKTTGEVWYPGDTLHMAIGQGFILTTPLQISNLLSTLSLNGKQFPPHLGLKITNPDSKVLKEFKFDTSFQLPYERNHIATVKDGLSQVPKTGGTAWPLFTFPLETAGKTGTAEYGDPSNRTHAWYTTYAPVSNPKIVVTVLIEGGGEGSSVAAPVAKELLRWYFSPDKTNLIKDVY